MGGLARVWGWLGWAVVGPAGGLGGVAGKAWRGEVAAGLPIPSIFYPNILFVFCFFNFQHHLEIDLG